MESIVFFGTGPVAAASLELLAKWIKIEAVVSKPKPAHHRGSFPVLDVAERLQIPVLPVTDQAALDALFITKPVSSRLGILIDFGIIVSPAVIEYFPLGIVNSHFSILPEWRGADPISFAILSGQAMTGVSIMLLVEALDEGPLLGYGEQPLDGTETTPRLTQRLILLSDALLQHDIPRHLAGETKGGADQSITGRPVSYSRKLDKTDGILDFTKPAVQLEREIRAFSDWPKSRTTLAGKDVIVTAAHVALEQPDMPTIALKTADGYLCIDRLKPAGKAEMTAQAFLAGNRL